MTLASGLALMGGLGLFLFGMKLMGEGLEKAAGSRLKRVLELVTGNRLLGVLAGMAVTALVQSSSATTVMTVGFVNAGLMSLGQAVGVIMGANVGTTATSLLLSVQVDFAAVFACAGLLLSNLPQRYASARQFGTVAMGLGILFVGMQTMSDAMVPLRSWEGFRQAMLTLKSPLWGVLTGVLMTAVLQSSSASVGILQALAGEGVLPLASAVFILFGQNIGTCVTALLACRDATTTARRAAVVHLLFNVLGTALFVVIALALPFTALVEALAPGQPRLQIALTHVLFNVGTTAVLLPLAGVLERLSCLLVRPHEPQAQSATCLHCFDPRFMKTPPIAAAQLMNEARRMGGLAATVFADAMDCFDQWDEEKARRVVQTEETLDQLNREITAWLVEVRGLDLSAGDARRVGRLFHVVNDLERIGDHSVNILQTAQRRQGEKAKFSAKAVQELDGLSALVAAQLRRTLTCLGKRDAPMRGVMEAEADIDHLVTQLRERHVERLKSRKCSAQNGMLYLDMLTDLERIGDHAENLATGWEGRD